MGNRDGRKGMGVGEGARGHEWMYSVCMKCEKINTISHEMCVHGVSLLPLYSLSVNSCLPLEAIGLPLAISSKNWTLSRMSRYPHRTFRVTPTEKWFDCREICTHALMVIHLDNERLKTVQDYRTRFRIFTIFLMEG